MLVTHLSMRGLQSQVSFFQTSINCVLLLEFIFESLILRRKAVIFIDRRRQMLFAIRESSFDLPTFDIFLRKLQPKLFALVDKFPALLREFRVLVAQSRRFGMRRFKLVL